MDRMPMQSMPALGAGGGAAPSPPLVERDEALTAIADALDAAVAGAGRLVAIEGDAGTGKTRLLAEAVRLAGERGMRRHRARATELERGFPFAVARRLLERPLAELGKDERGALLAAAAAPAVELLLGAPPAAAPPRDAMFALVNGIYWICARFAEERPTAVVIDDLHWADGASTHALAFLASRVEELPLALLVATRSGEPLAGPDPRGELAQSGAAIGLVTRPLSPAATAQLLVALLGRADPAFLAAAHQATGGNPFLLRELALTVARERIEPDERAAERLASVVPEAVRGWALRRLTPLPTAASELARSLAVLETADLRIAAAHAGLDSMPAREAADRLAESGLVDRELPLRFTHPLVRAAIHDEIPPASRDEAHHAAAKLLLDDRAAPETVASHLFACEPRGEPWASAILRATAASAFARGAPDAAVLALERAVAEGPDPALLAELGRARVATNDPSAVGDLEAAAATAEPAASAPILGALAQARYLAGDVRGAFEAAGKALERIPPGTGGAAEAELLLGRLMAGRQVPELVGAVRIELDRPRVPETGGPDVPAAEVVRRTAIALDAFLRGERETAIAQARWVADRLEALSGADDVPVLLAIGPAFVLTGLGEWERSAKLISAGIAHARRRGSRLETAEHLHDRVWWRWRSGDVTGGLADIETVDALTEGAWDPSKVPMRVACAHLLIERGDVHGAAAALELSPELESRVPGTWGWPWLALGRAAVAAACARWEEAFEQAVAAGRRAAEIDATSPEWIPWRSLAARAAARLGDDERARELAAADLAVADAIQAPRARGNALAALASVAGPGEGVEALRGAVDALDDAGAGIERARARLELGMVLRRDRHLRDARGPLREALDLAHRIGSPAIAERALAELRAAGGRPRRLHVSGTGALTPREREIARLAADGCGNVEIAERLFITRKTVEGHLRTIFRKLGIGRRDQIRGALGE